MLEYLEQLRHKPVTQRKKAAIILAAFLTGVLFLIWLSTFNFDSAVLVDSEAVAEELKPIEEIKTSAVNFYESLKRLSANVFGAQSISTQTR